jgi:hypothetical protein
MKNIDIMPPPASLLFAALIAVAADWASVAVMPFPFLNGHPMRRWIHRAGFIHAPLSVTPAVMCDHSLHEIPGMKYRPMPL